MVYKLSPTSLVIKVMNSILRHIKLTPELRFNSTNPCWWGKM